MSISRAQVEKVARLARLALADQELDRMSEQLAEVLEYIEQLAEVDTEGVEPLAHCLPMENVFRVDEEQPSLGVDRALANAPKRSGDFYAVPAILD